MRSPNYQIDTDRQQDISLGRCLKNWANRHTPPKEARQKLLDAAALLQPQHKIWWQWRLFNTLAWKISYKKYPRNSWIRVNNKTGYEIPKLPSDIDLVTIENYFLTGLVFRPVW